MTIIEKIAAIREIPCVTSVNEWKGKRAYINVANYRQDWAGCRSYQFYVDLATGRLVDQRGKGRYPSEFAADLEVVSEAWQALT